ncbi:Fn3 associated [Marinitoga hydrogenitolerans DSM 16785]|uniref:Fn3 associated n=1 Tax=Marinitoga hydrogenitolerans (strain DSM 16785 / JCM 12826 / AT1271) TaxID=1122195 RepID=A0A1M4WD82_MARH1|nr:CotH kinase family protein [Marinitoga hydrogenitolerans]SHE79199.1 Fn3 associated [Marinitoga hydrogenitolerans DSM 16785]
MKKVFILIIILINISIFSIEKAINPIFSKEAGFYSKPFSLKLFSNAKDARIYYTIDGSDPKPGKKNTYLYTKPIEIKDMTLKEGIEYIKTSPEWKVPRGNVFKGMIIKAKAIWNNIESEIVTKSYFIGKKYDILAISIVVSPEKLFDPNEGIYIPGVDYNKKSKFSSWTGNYYRRGKESEVEVHVEFFENGKLIYKDNLGMRISGNFSRMFPMKSLKFYARDKYGEKKIKIPIFPDLKNIIGEEIKKYDKFMIRNGGNEFGKIFFKDAFMQTVISNMGFETQAYRPAVHFINGVYWGLGNVRERYSKDYFKEHYFIDDISIIELTSEFKEHFVLNEGNEEALKDFKDLRNFILNNDMNKKDNYEYIKTKLDIQNYINFYISEMFFDNRDWPSNNMKFWRKNEKIYNIKGYDGKWRLAIYDMDNGMYTISSNMFKHTIDDHPEVEFHPNPIWSTIMFKKLLSNKNFKEKFINSYLDRLNTTFLYTNTSQIFLNMFNQYSPYLKEYLNRWNLMNYEKYMSMVEYNLSFLKKRPEVVKKQMKEYFNINIVKLELKRFSGKIKINTVEFTKGQKIEYAKEIPITLTAIGNFKYWIINGDKKFEKNITIYPKEGLEIKPVFEEEKNNFLIPLITLFLSFLGIYILLNSSK